MSARDQRWTSGRELAGLVIIVIGFGMLLQTMNVFPFGSILFRYWLPAVFVAVGALCLSNARSHGARVGSFLLIGFGVLLFLDRFTVWNFNPFRLLGPALIIWVGVVLLMKNSRQQSRESEGPFGIQESVDSSDFISATAILGGYDRRCTSENFRGGDLTAIMGGGKVDLRDAKIQTEGSALDVFALMGGIEVLVPTDWIVENQVTPILGGCEDSTRPPKEGGKRLTIRGTALMGGISIKN